MSKLTLGSLFDGSGGFPLGGLIAGMTPVWASEIEPFPIRVTTKRMPFIKHYGDVTAMNGGKIEPVDIITFGSPCQDMSVAGKRGGLDESRSGLFYEAVRIIKEMREATDGEYPRYAVWENVPGAFSSNKGRDFQSVLNEIIKIAEPEAPEVPMPKEDKWAGADCYMGDGWSVAYRTLDAQYWGVPQRRKRIYLVADFAGISAGKILFESEGLSGYSAEGFSAWQKTARSVEACIGAAGICLNDQGGSRMDVTDDVTATLRAEAHHPPCVVEAAGFCPEHSAKSRGIGYEEEVSPTLRAGVVPAAVALENHPQDSRITMSDDGKIQTLTSNMGSGGNNRPLVMSIDTPKTLKIRSGCEGGGKGALIQENLSATISCHNDQTLFEPKAYGINSFDVSRTLDCSGGTPVNHRGGTAIIEPDSTVYTLTTGSFLHSDKNKAPTLTARDYKDPTTIVEKELEAVRGGYKIRCLTPTECGRLQGFPDWWCDDLGTEKPSDEELYFWYKVFEGCNKRKNPKWLRKWLKNPRSDTAEYKMWGNGVALPCVVFVLSGIVYYDEVKYTR